MMPAISSKKVTKSLCFGYLKKQEKESELKYQNNIA